MIALIFIAYIVTLKATPAPTCENYGEKVEDIDGQTGLTRDDPCFGYSYSCCGELNDYCYWKNTTNCNNCELGIGYGGCAACCDSYDGYGNPSSAPTEPTKEPTTPEPTTDDSTPAPTVHSAKKWTMLHPKYEGADGELLWNIYYGDYGEDHRFDDFRQQQLWDVEVIRSLIEEDVKTMNLGHQINTKHGKGSVLSHHWLMMAAAAMVIVALFALWMNRRGSYTKIVESVESQPLVATYGH